MLASIFVKSPEGIETRISMYTDSHRSLLATKYIYQVDLCERGFAS